MTAFKPGDRVFHPGYLRDGTITEVRIETIFIVQLDGRTDLTVCKSDDLQRSLEPAGEPMQTDSNTFKHKDTITQVYALAPGELAVNTFGDRYDVKGTQALVDAKDAPALALAILEATHSNAFPLAPEVARAMEALEEYKQRIQAEAEEAADREQLDAEALDLYNRVMRSGKEPLSEWLSTLQFTRIKYTNIAKAARERYGVTK